MFAVVAATCWLACEEEEIVYREDVIMIEGTVTDSVSGLALESVAISLNDTVSIDTYTDSAGRYEYVEGGTSATVYAMKEGYRTKSKFTGSHPAVDTLDFQLAPE
jgi:hypothetical protein